MRTYQHIIDTAAVKATLNAIPHHWVIRELTERDYGIDLMIEIFEKDGVDHKQHDIYEATGHVCYLQIKGTNTAFEPNADDSVSFALDKDSLLYMERFPTAFILLHVCVLKGHEDIRFLWLQRYVMDVLDFEKTDWRESAQEHFSVRMPPQNSLPDNAEKIEMIAGMNRHITESAEYQERYEMVKQHKYAMIDNPAYNGYADLLKELNRIKRLTTLLRRNNLCVGFKAVEELIAYIKEIRDGGQTPGELEDFPHDFNMDQLALENSSRIFMASFIADNEEDTAY